MGYRIFKRGDKYHVQVNYEGIKERRSLKTSSKREADAKALEFYNSIVNAVNDSDPLIIRGLQNISFGDYVSEYIKSIEATQEKSKASLDREKYSLKHATTLDKIPLRKIRRQDIEKILAEYLAKGNSPGGANIVLRNLKTIFQKAVDWEWIPKNPCKGISAYKIPEKAPPYLTLDEIGNLLDKAEVHSVELYRYCSLGIYAGLRRMELAFTKWEWLDFERGVINVRSDDFGKFKTKNRKNRTIPMNENIREVLEPFKNCTGYIFNSGRSSDGKFKYRYDPKKAFRTVCNAAGLPKVTPHWLRHTFGSQLAMKGISIYKISRWMGHSDIKTTQIYAHLQPQDDPDINW